MKKSDSVHDAVKKDSRGPRYWAMPPQACRRLAEQVIIEAAKDIENARVHSKNESTGGGKYSRNIRQTNKNYSADARTFIQNVYKVQIGDRIMGSADFYCALREVPLEDLFDWAENIIASKDSED